MDLMEMLAGASGRGNFDGTTPLKNFTEEAKDFVKHYNETETFQPGDLVEWKPGMKNSKVPEYGSPVMVLDVYDAPIRRENDGTPYGGEPNDMRCLTMKSDSGIHAFPFDSHRFTKYQG